MLDLRNSDGSLMALICSSMPQRLKDQLMANLIGAFDGRDILYSRQVSDGPQSFGSLHFSWYNRYTTQVSQLLDKFGCLFFICV